MAFPVSTSPTSSTSCWTWPAPGSASSCASRSARSARCSRRRPSRRCDGWRWESPTSTSAVASPRKGPHSDRWPANDGPGRGEFVGRVSGQHLRLLLATSNPGKLRELRAILGGVPVELVGLTELGDGPPPEVEETGATFLDNARSKARAYAAWSGLAAVADDSGLEVDALGGAPGVRSARYAGEGASDRANLDKLLRELAGVPPERRGARFRCTAVLAAPPGTAPDPPGTVGAGSDPRGTAATAPAWREW